MAAPLFPHTKETTDIYSLSDQGLANIYRFVEEIGFGNWGSVWACEHRNKPPRAPDDDDECDRESRVAVKVVFRHKTPTTAARVKSLWNEMKIVRSFKYDPHPSIVPFHNFIITPSYALITMQYLPRLIPVEVSETKAREWFRSLLSGVEFLHKRGVVHNDIKPANILLSPATPPVPVLVDFGFAEKYDTGSRKAFISNLAYGTPEYLSPERARGLPHDTRKSDVWSLGITFFEILVGRTPFEEHEGEVFSTKEDLERYWARTMKGKWVGVWKFSRGVEKLLKRMISPNADLRYTARDASADVYFMDASEGDGELGSPALTLGDKSKIMDLSLPWLDSAPSTVSSSRVKTMGHDRQSSISSTKSRKSLASRLPSLGKSKVKVHIDSENQVPAPPPPTPANPPKPSSLASTSAPRSNAGLPARKAPRKPVPSLIPEETDEDRSRATAIVAQTAASRRKPFENLTNRPESNKSPKDYTSSKHVPKRQKSKALPPIRLSEGPTSPGDEVVAAPTHDESRNSSTLDLLKHNFKQSIEKSVKLYKSSIHASTRQSLVTTDTQSRQVSNTVTEPYSTEGQDIQEPEPEVPSHADEPPAEQKRVDRMSAWIRSVESAVEDTRQDFARRSSPPPLALPPGPSRTGKYRRKPVPVHEIFEDAPSNTSSQTHFATQLNQSSVSGFEPEIGRRASSNYVSAEGDFSGTMDYSFRSAIANDQSIDSVERPSAADVRHASEVYQSTVTIPEIILNDDTPISGAADSTFSDNFTSRTSDPELLTQSYSLEVRQEVQDEEDEHNYEEILLASTNVRRVGQGFQSDNCGPVMNSTASKDSHRKSGRFFHTLKRDSGFPKPVSSEDRRAVSVDELGFTPPETDSLQPRAATAQGKNEAHGYSFLAMRKALRAVVSAATLNRRASRLL